MPAGVFMDALEVSAAAESVDVVVKTAFGTLSCAVNPVEMGGQILKAAQSLQQAAEAAAVCEEICRDIMQTAVECVPEVCKLLRLGQLFPDDSDDLATKMLRACQSVWDHLREAATAMREYLQSNWLSQDIFSPQARMYYKFRSLLRNLRGSQCHARAH